MIEEKPIHQPTLESINMVENAIKINPKLGKYQLWLKLPRKMMYQTFSFILDYLEKSNKITISQKKIIWSCKEREKLFKTPLITKNMAKGKINPDYETEKLVESLNPDERAILDYLELKNLKAIVQVSGLDETQVMRALQFLSNKKIVRLETKQEKIIELGENGVIYLKNGLPERRFLNLVAEKKEISLQEASKLSKLSDNEFKAALGVLKNKAMINLKQSKIILTANKEEIIKKSLEERFLESLPLSLDSLKPEQKLAFQNLKSRKDIIKIEDEKNILIELTGLGKKLVNTNLSGFKEMIEQLTPEIIKNDSWKNKKFRRYDIISNVPKISGGKRHFVNQACDYARKIWADLGFKEMTGTLTQTGFWNFDALFTAQDHPVREIHDTFYLPIKGKLPEKKIWEAVKKAHEQGVDKSKGWRYKWNEEEASRVILRTHTTCLSAKTLAKLKPKDLPAKFFAVGKCFRNETVDWKHGFEFNQTEGIVVDENANFRNLLGYLQEFAKKMGYEKVRFRPHYFPYTEPSLEGDVWNKEKGEWMEVFAAGIFRPEVTQPLLGKPIPVLAWGPGFDRMMMMLYQIQDFREIYKNNLNMLRSIKFWEK